jgi:hypothetical protein
MLHPLGYNSTAADFNAQSEDRNAQSRVVRSRYGRRSSDAGGDRTGQQLQAGYRGDAHQSEPGRLADVQPYLRRATLQPAQAGEQGECRAARLSLDARAGSRRNRNHTAGAQRRDVPGGAGRRRGGHRCHQRRFAVGVQAQDGRCGASCQRPDQDHRHLWGHDPVHRAGQQRSGPGRQDGRTALADQSR